MHWSKNGVPEAGRPANGQCGHISPSEGEFTYVPFWLPSMSVHHSSHLLNIWSLTKVFNKSTAQGFLIHPSNPTELLKNWFYRFSMHTRQIILLGDKKFTILNKCHFLNYGEIHFNRKCMALTIFIVKFRQIFNTFVWRSISQDASHFQTPTPYRKTLPTPQVQRHPYIPHC